MRDMLGACTRLSGSASQRDIAAAYRRTACLSFNTDSSTIIARCFEARRRRTDVEASSRTSRRARRAHAYVFRRRFHVSIRQAKCRDRTDARTNFTKRNDRHGIRHARRCTIGAAVAVAASRSAK